MQTEQLDKERLVQDTTGEKVLITLEEKVEPRHSAVMVIDVQNDFCHEEGYIQRRGIDVSASQAMVGHLENFIEEARKAKVEVVFVQAIYNNRYLGGPFKERDLRAGVKKERCVEGSWGACFYRVEPLPGEMVIKKHRYSAFVGTELGNILQEKGIKTLIMTGVTTNVCVESTARDAFMRDYYVVFLEDCTAADSKGVHESALRNIQRHFGVVVGSADVVGIWKNRAVG